MGSKEWIEAGSGAMDLKRPYSVSLPSGKRMAVFFYDGGISHDIAFGHLLEDGNSFLQRLLRSFSNDQGGNQLVHIATDGESYGHHHRFGDMALAFCLDRIESTEGTGLTVYAEFLEENPPEYEVEVIPNSSWSCVHGVERWRSGCGCHTGQNPGWTQAWRTPLRQAMDWLRDQLGSIYAGEMARYTREPWELRDAYIRVVLDRSEGNVTSFFSEHMRTDHGQADKINILKLLEMQRNAMLMYTSCGWFFDEISGIEAVQVLNYAGRAMQLAKEIMGKDLEPGYLAVLEKAPSNNPAFTNGAEVYVHHVKPAALDLIRIGVHFAVSSLFEEYPETVRIGVYTAQKQAGEILESGGIKLSVGRALIRSLWTWEKEVISYAVLHLGNQNLNGGARPFSTDRVFSSMQSEITGAFKEGDIPRVVRLMDSHFGDHNYSLWHLLRDKKREILNKILESTLEEAETSLREVYEKHYSVMYALKENNIPLPKAFGTAMGFILNADFKRSMEKNELDLVNLESIIEEFRKWELQPDKSLLGFAASQRLNGEMARIRDNPENLNYLENIAHLLKLLADFPLNLDLWKSQNIYFTLCQQHMTPMKERSREGDVLAGKWMEGMESLGKRLSVKCL